MVVGVDVGLGGTTGSSDLPFSCACAICIEYPSFSRCGDPPDAPPGRPHAHASRACGGSLGRRQRVALMSNNRAEDRGAGVGLRELDRAGNTSYGSQPFQAVGSSNRLTHPITHVHVVQAASAETRVSDCRATPSGTARVFVFRSD